MNQENNVRIAYGKLLNRCWKDPKYEAKFRENPAACLEEFGMPTVPGAKYHIVKPEDMPPSTEQDIYLPWIEKPKTRELSIDMVDAVASGSYDEYMTAGEMEAMAGIFITKSNVVVNSNAVVDGTVGVESIAGAVTIAMAVTIG